MENKVIDFYIPVLLALLAISAGLWKWKLLSTPTKIFLIALMLETIVNTTAGLYPAATPLTFAIYHGEILVNYILLCLFFGLSTPVLQKKKAYIYFMIGGALYWLFCMIMFWKIPHGASSRFEMLSSFVTILLSFIAVYTTLRTAAWHNTRKLPVFWISGGIFLSSVISYAFTILFEVLVKHESMFWAADKFIMSITYLTYLVYTYAFSLHKKQPHLV